MILITTPRGIVEMPCPQPEDAESIQGNCGHGVSLFDPCLDCILGNLLERFYGECAK